MRIHHTDVAEVLKNGNPTELQKIALEAYMRTSEITAAAESLGLTFDTVRNRIRKAVNRFNRQNVGITPAKGFEVVKLSTDAQGVLTATKQRPIPDEDTPPPPNHTVKGVSTLYDAQGEVTAKWVKTQQSAIDQANGFEDAVEAFVKKFEGFAGRTSGPHDLVMPDTAAFYGLGDMHVGLLSWAEETGHNMDLKIILDLGKRAVDMLVDRTLPSEVAYFVNVGDFFHADDRTQKTPNGGNNLDVDGRFDRVADVGFELMHYMVSSLRRKHSTIHIVNAKGNHDPHMTKALVSFLKAMFKDDENIIVHPCESPLQLFRFGKNLVGVTHGDGVKAEKIPEVVSIVGKEHWTDMEYCWVMTGHIHHKQKTFEKGGVIVESFNTLGVGDHWHVWKGYVGVGRWFESVTLSRAGGECARARVTVNSKGELI